MTQLFPVILVILCGNMWTLLFSPPPPHSPAVSAGQAADPVQAEGGPEREGDDRVRGQPAAGQHGQVDGARLQGPDGRRGHQRGQEPQVGAHRRGGEPQRLEGNNSNEMWGKAWKKVFHFDLVFYMGKTNECNVIFFDTGNCNDAMQWNASAS